MRTGAAKVEQIPVIWALPEHVTRERRLVIWLAPGLCGMEVVQPALGRLAAAGFVAVSFDSWERGSRATEALVTLLPRAWANWPLVAWPIHGHGALEVLRVLDWAASAFDVSPPFSVGGASLGGDFAVAAAGLDRRIGCVAAVVATPDLRRPVGRRFRWRGPASLAAFVAELGPRARAGTIEEVGREAPVLIEAIPFGRLRELPIEGSEGQVLVTAASYIPGRDGDLDLGGTKSEYVARLFPRVRVVKAFNTIRTAHLGEQGDTARPLAERRAIPLAIGVVLALLLAVLEADSPVTQVRLGPLSPRPNPDRAPPGTLWLPG